LHLDDALVAPIRFAEKRTPIDLDGRSPDETPFPSLLKRGPRCSDQSRTATHATLLTDSVNEMLSGRGPTELPTGPVGAAARSSILDSTLCIASPCIAQRTIGLCRVYGG
jgi:hypothetical protein